MHASRPGGTHDPLEATLEAAVARGAIEMDEPPTWLRRTATYAREARLLPVSTDARLAVQGDTGC
jgi:hypothetical protein